MAQRAVNAVFLECVFYLPAGFTGIFWKSLPLTHWQTNRIHLIWHVSQKDVKMGLWWFHVPNITNVKSSRTPGRPSGRLWSLWISCKARPPKDIPSFQAGFRSGWAHTVPWLQTGLCSGSGPAPWTSHCCWNKTSNAQTRGLGSLTEENPVTQTTFALCVCLFFFNYQGKASI